MAIKLETKKETFEVKTTDGEKHKIQLEFIKRLELDCVTYPELKIEQLDLCPDGNEEVSIYLGCFVNMKKKDLFNMLKLQEPHEKTLFSIDDKIPAKIVIECNPEKFFKGERGKELFEQELAIRSVINDKSETKNSPTHTFPEAVQK